jgi:hypothetical protein
MAVSAGQPKLFFANPVYRLARMGTGEFKLAKQVGQMGFYAHVGLSAEPNDNGEVVVEFAEKSGSEWRSGARFGIDYALEHALKETKYQDGLIIRVQMIHGMVCDTTDSLVAYAAARAVFQALGIERTNAMPNFDPDRGVVEFSK